MARELNSVKIDPAERGYHHGALRQALIDAAEAVIAERGVDGFSLRETARRAGVSPAAPGHHFRDARGLLTALAAQAFREFGNELEAADVGSSRESRIRSQGRAYVRFALANRAKFDLMWRKALIDDLDPEYTAAGNRAFAILDRVVRGEQCASSELTDSSIAPSVAAWSIVHGFARLAIDGVFETEPDAAQRAADTLLPQILDCLRV
jgi:AcrR family transcriptional regulator